MKEPSVLDYVKSRLAFWRKQTIEIPPEIPEVAPEVEPVVEISLAQEAPKPEVDFKVGEPWLAWSAIRLPVIMICCLLILLTGQFALEPQNRNTTLGLAFYLFAVAAFGFLLWRGKLLPPEEPQQLFVPDNLTYRPWLLLVGMIAAVIAFLAFGGDEFNQVNLFLWAIAIFCVGVAFWKVKVNPVTSIRKLIGMLTQEKWHIQISRWNVLILYLLAIILFFRLYQLNQVPPEMVSDHAEKILDVSDVLNGKTSIFFPRNTGREAFQMYLTAAVALVFGTGLSFLSLKIGTALAGLVTLPFIYLLGKEVGNKKVGLIAMAFAGIAYWPNVISRIALRFSLYPLFVAPTFYFMLRGFRTSNRNDFILAGIFLGLGLHGYSPFRIVPLIVLFAFLLILFHKRDAVYRRQVLFWFVLVVLISFLVFLPLFRYALSNPEMFNYRLMTRLGTAEKPLDGPAWQIFLSNLWKAMIMFGWDNGEVWVVSIPHRPALSIVSAALFYLGMGIVLARYLKKRNWVDLFLLCSIPMLMLPSILSLAFPSENPILNRTAGAIVPVFLMVGIALETILRTIHNQLGKSWGTYLVVGIGIFLFTWSAFQDYDLVFKQYQQYYQRSAWNTSVMGMKIRSFADSIGSLDQAWVVAYPYWVDTRLVGIQAGNPTRDYAISADRFQETTQVASPKLFIINPLDRENLSLLGQLYPTGKIQVYQSAIEGKNFLMLFVP